MRIKVYKSASPSPDSQKPTRLALSTHAEEPAPKRRRLSCEETGFQPPPPLEFDSVNDEWQQSRSSVMDLKVSRELKISPSAPGSTVTTAPATTVSIRGDGNCFWRAISYLLTGAQSDHGKLRATVCDWIDNHRNAVKNLSNLDDYIEQSNMRSLGVFATEIELFCTASLLNTSIWTYSPFGKEGEEQRYIWQEHSPIKGTHSHFAQSRKAIYLKNTHEHFEPVLSV